MFSWMGRIAEACWGPVRWYVRMRKDEDDDDDALLWSKDIGRHAAGDFSFAIVQANEVLEDYSQVEIGRDAIFVGVYDGHGGADASRFISNHLFLHLMSKLLF